VKKFFARVIAHLRRKFLQSQPDLWHAGFNSGKPMPHNSDTRNLKARDQFEPNSCKTGTWSRVFPF
jgi:hypothetical protein